jgi:hypothetical protein
MSISVITTNVFPGTRHIEFAIRCLGAQTYKDFEWVFVDAFHDRNESLVRELCDKHGLKWVIHAPLCPPTHVGRRYHWESYNTALMFSTRYYFVRLGVYRYFHQDLVRTALEHANDGVWLNISQRAMQGFNDDLSFEEINQKYDVEMDCWDKSPRLESHCGMFSFSRAKMIEMNGNNEALLIHHWEDGDFNSRLVQAENVPAINVHKSFLRIEHCKEPASTDGPFLGKRVCEHHVNPNCIFYAKNNHDIENNPVENTHWFDYKGFLWAKCDVCGTVAVSNADKYFHYLKTDPRGMRAPINVQGIGRNIGILDDDLKKLTSFQSKVELLTSSHTDPRYLEE